MSTALKTFGVAFAIALITNLLGGPDFGLMIGAGLVAVVEATGTIAAAIRFITSLLVWWAIVYLVATRIPRGSRPS